MKVGIRNFLVFGLVSVLQLGCSDYAVDDKDNKLNAVQGKAEVNLIEQGQDNVLMSFDGQRITKEDFNNVLQAVVPQDRQKEFLVDEKNVRQLIANLYITRKLADQMRAQGVSDETKWAAQYQFDRVLMLSRINQYLKSLPEPDFISLADEYYKANPDKFTRPDSISVSHILLGGEGVKDEDARALAEEVLAKVKQGSIPFSDLAVEYSKDPSVSKNKGDLGYFHKGEMVPEFDEAAFALAKVGDISPIVKSPFGYHIIKLQGVKKGELIPFNEVKDKLVADEKVKFNKEAQSKFIDDIKSAKGIVVNQEAVDSLVVKKEGSK